MYHVSHFCVGVANLYEGAARLRDETGLQHYDGGWFAYNGVAQKTVPIGKVNYIEIESVIDSRMANENPFGAWFNKVISRGDHLMGWNIRADTLDEIEAFANRHDLEIGDSWGRELPDGSKQHVYITPRTGRGANHTWPVGLPKVIHWTALDRHPANAFQVAHRNEPDGIAWLEVGEEAVVREWLGDIVAELPLRYVDRPAGLYAVGIALKNGGEVVIRRPSPTNWASWEGPDYAEAIRVAASRRQWSKK